MLQQMRWGDALLVLDNAAFREGYWQGRSFYFHGGCHARDAKGNAMLPASDVLRVLALEDENGRFYLDAETFIEDDLEELLGWLAGYLSGPLHPETCEELHAWESSLPNAPKRTA